MTQTSAEFLAAIGLLCLLALPLMLCIAVAEKPRRRPAKGKSVKLNTWLR